jgi:tetrahydromethanopterin S-methyltransferase subunit C
MSIGGSVFLIAVGAILRYAVQDSLEGVNLEVVGLILMIAGAIALVASLIWGAMATRRTTVYDDRYDRGYRGSP